MKGNNRKQVRKLAAAALAFSVLMSSPAYAADIAGSGTTVSTQAIPSFTDVSSTHWALKHITKLAAMGVIQGYEKGEYRPENSVSQQEVIVMALRLMGLEGEVQKSKTDIVLPFAVDSYFKPYVAYAFDKGLINIQEEADGTNAKTAWGAREATREWVAKLVIRAIGKQSLAQQQASAPVSFKDGKDFSSWATGYVNAAVSLNIVQGFEDNSFQPKGKVTRAQMATFLSRADKNLTTRTDRVVTGYVMSLTDRKISVMNANGDTKDYNLSTDTVIYNAKDDSRIPASAIKLTNEVYVVQSSGNALYIELTNDQQKLETIEGTLNQVVLSDMILLLQQGSNQKVVYLDPNVAVTDKDGRGMSLSSIAPGSVIQLSRNTLLKEQKFSQIVVKQIPVSKQAEGTVTNIDKTQNKITFLEKTTGQPETYSIAANAFVTLPDGTPADLSRLHIGDQVSYNVKTNEMSSVTVKKTADVSTTVQGTLSSISDDKKILTITRAGGTNELGAYYLADNAIVTIDGLTNASLYDLEAGDDLKLELVNNKVVSATVTSRSIKQITFATIVKYDPDTKGLMVSSDNGDLSAYKMSDNTAIKYLDATIPLSNFQSMFIDSALGNKAKKVDLKVSKNKIVQIQLSSQIDGTVAQLNTSTNQLTIRTAGGQNLTFNTVSSVPVDMLNRSGATLSDLKVGDAITIQLNLTQDYINQITFKKVGVYKTIVTNTSTRQISVKDDTGAQLTFTIDSNDRISNPGKATHDFEDLQVDEYVKATFNGSKLDTVQLLNTVRGKVTAVDPNALTLTVQDFQGAVQVIPVGQQFVIKQNGNVSAAITTIKPNDRVEIIKDANDKLTIQIANASKRIVSSYDVVLNQLLLKPTANGDKTTYNFFSKAYLHKGTTNVAANAFMENEEIMLYTLDDKIIEIEKQ
ncbi:S-layer homology domain-containing protein [Paenibacillus filicis]|uniref:S-layer homology domain-containing protein n=1 Tax=Paenibacillus gyeongsangnamensis TaxID=3388067 RepID=A0ABT4Q7Z3_9BACL|nr:S-layer homology domain-containing protein [Paenibacillus filicis]MCZ8512993.1 S-layer homology domain-containing protein [Paenibacillus filicis]